MHMCMCIEIDIPEHNLSSSCEYFCMLSRMAVWHWTTHWCALPGEDHLSLSQLYSLVYSYLCRVETSWDYPHTVRHVLWYPPYSAHM